MLSSTARRGGGGSSSNVVAPGRSASFGGTSSSSSAGAGGPPIQHFYQSKWATLLAAAFCLGSFSLLPILLLETSSVVNPIQQQPSSSSNSDSNNKNNVINNAADHVSVHHIANENTNTRQQQQQQEVQVTVVDGDITSISNNNIRTKQTKDGRTIMDVQLSDLQQDDDFSKRMSHVLGRGVAAAAGVVVSPDGGALEGAKRAHIECDINVDSLAYWNDPQGIRDREFQSPFATLPTTTESNDDNNNKDDDDVRYISFESDRGGWNNVRMCMEIIFVIAAVTGRTLILPPKEPLYLLHNDKADKYRGFADFFPTNTIEFQKRLKTISFEEFITKVGTPDNTELKPSQQLYNAALNAADHCENRAKSDASCKHVSAYLESISYMPEWNAGKSCIVFDENEYVNDRIDDISEQRINKICGKRNIEYWTHELQKHKLIHFRAGHKEYRLLTHFYGMIHFTNPTYDHYYKRFVRDFLHYHDQIYCAAGKIVKAIQIEAQLTRGGIHVPDVNTGASGYAALHVRRGDLQYKKVKIPSAEIYRNTAELYLPKEILYIATDERDKSFFNDLATYHELRYLDDYWELAGLSDLDPNYMGMIDTIVASRGRIFIGTWFSTFSGYINRLRGYHGLSMQDSWYAWLPKKDAVHVWPDVDHFAYAFEWPDGWIGIDSDQWPDKSQF